MNFLRDGIMGLRGNGEEFLLQPEGRLDLRGGSRLQQQFETIALRRYKLWVIDMSCIEFIDSFGLASLVAGLNAATQVNARLILCSLRPSAQLIFEITQLDQVFTIFESHEAMLSGLAVPAIPTLPTLEVA
jgi:anti-sigma B factor antagonist